MEDEIKKRLDEQAAKIEAIYISVEKTRRYFQWIFWITIIALVLPLLGLVFAIPSFLSLYTDALGGSL